jgi:hypothetical protein
MGSLPAVGGDVGVWGTELNIWLLADHDVDGTHSFNTFTAADHGLLAWNYDPALISSTLTTVTAGVVWLSRINVRYSMSVFNVIIETGTNGAGLTAGQNFAGLYNSAGTRVAVTADQTTPWATAGLQTMALASGPFTLSTGYYWVAVLQNFSTTSISLARGGNGMTAAFNAGLTVSTARAAQNGSGATALPASITPSSNTFTSSPFWCALS